jgi:hypothetical protein
MLGNTHARPRDRRLFKPSVDLASAGAANSRRQSGANGMRCSMATYRQRIQLLVDRIMKEDAAGRSEPDPRLIRELQRLARLAQVYTAPKCHT